MKYARICIEICTKMLRNVSEKRRAKCPSITLSYFVVKIACLMMLSRQFDSEASPVERQQLQRKMRKGEKVKAKKIKKTKKTEILISAPHDRAKILQSLL